MHGARCTIFILSYTVHLVPCTLYLFYSISNKTTDLAGNEIFSFPPDIFLDVFAGIKDTSVRLNFDVGNSTAEASVEGDEIRLLSKVIDKVETLHVCDMKERGRFSPTLVGTGVTPLRELFTFIREHGFDGWLCIEEAGGLGMDGVRKAHDYVREVWESSAK